MILTDRTHLVTTGDISELHQFSERIGLRRRWFQDHRIPHYDLTTENMSWRARHAGAKRVTTRELIEFLRAAADA
jgi:hypothetical protein